MKALLVAIGLTLVASSVQAQEVAVSYDLGIFLAGVDPATGGLPISTTNFPVSAASCGLVKVAPPPTVTNPKELRIDDPADATKQCSIAAASTALAAVPFGIGYRGAVRAHGATTTAAWSDLSNPFDRAVVPVLRVTGVVIR